MGATTEDDDRPLIRAVTAGQIMGCPERILAADHYRPDGTCHHQRPAT